MDNRLNISVAIQIANRSYPDTSLGLEFRAVSVLSSQLEHAYRDQHTSVGAHSLDEIEDSLMNLIVRQSHSADFRSKVQDARERILRYILMSPRLLGDIKYWDKASHDERVQTCSIIMKEINTVFRQHEGLPPAALPRVQWTFSSNKKCYIDEYRNNHDYIPTVWADPKKILDTDVIWVNTHGKSRFDDPYAVIAGIYGEYIPLVQRYIGRISNTFFSSTNGKIEHDIDLMNTAQHECGLVSPYLDRFNSAQFTTALIDSEKTAFSNALKKMIEEETDHVPVRKRTAEKIGHRIKVIAVSLLNFTQ